MEEPISAGIPAIAAIIVTRAGIATEAIEGRFELPDALFRSILAEVGAEAVNVGADHVRWGRGGRKSNDVSRRKAMGREDQTEKQGFP